MAIASKNTLSYKLTDKARPEAQGTGGKLRPSLRKLLASIGDGATFEEIWGSVPQVDEAKLREVLQKLVSGGYIEAIYSNVTASDLDITRYFNRPVVEPTIHQRKQAEQATIVGMRSLKQSGYYVNILNRSATRAAPHSGGKYNVLIIDSDERNTLVMARTLLLAGIDTRAAVRRDEIVAELARQPPVDVVAMDVVLPDVIGLELLGRLRQHPFFKTVPVIVMTARAQHEDVVAALAYGANGYMTKPFKPESLLESVKAVLGL
jgi:CheY-like chemotaxis protein